MEIQQTKERVRWIDIAKGICMIAVILGHQGISALDFVYSFHLTVFFILSGYTLKKEAITANYVKSKFTRLMVPFFLTCAAVTAMDVLDSQIVHQDSAINTVSWYLMRGIYRAFYASGGQEAFGPIRFGDAIGAVWFLPAMFFALLITQYLLGRFDSRRKQMAFAVAIALLSAASAQIIWFPFCIQAGAFAVPFILFGFVLREGNWIENVLKWWHYLICGVIFVFGCMGNYAQVFYMVSCRMGDWLITPICALASSLLVIGISKAIGRFKPLEFIGKHSLIFLCVHLFEMNTLYWVYQKLTLRFPIVAEPLVRIPIKFVLILLLSTALVLLKRLRASKPRNLVEGQRDQSMDVMRFLLIVLMIVGHVQVDYGFRKIVYSFHMMAFVLISGYFYQPQLSFKKNFKKTIKILTPYVIFAVGYVLVTHRGWLDELKSVLLGVSYTKKLFSDVITVGPVYFILLLFTTRLLYVCIDQIKNEWTKNGLILAIFLFSQYLGAKGYWLPWSMDCGMFSLLFYHAGHYLRKYQVLEKCKNHLWVYFPLSFMWMFMVYIGPMEISVRRYVNLGLTFVGVVSAFIVMYLLCSYLATHLPRLVVKAASLVGQSTAWILVLHTLFFGRLNAYIESALHLNSKNYYNLAVSILVQLIAGVGCFFAFHYFRRLMAFLRAKLFGKSRIAL